MKTINSLVPKVMFNAPLMISRENWTDDLHKVMTDKNSNYSILQDMLAHHQFSLADIRDYCQNPLDYQLTETWRLEYEKENIMSILFDKFPFATTIDIDNGFYIFNATITALDDGQILMQYTYNAEASICQTYEPDGSLYLREKSATISKLKFEEIVISTFKNVQLVPINDNSDDLAWVKKLFYNKLFVWNFPSKTDW